MLSFDVTSIPGPVAPRTAPGRPGGQVITSAQHAVAVLVVRGRSNAEIAKELGISTRTVANHVASILARTGARSRFDLARLMSG